MYPHLKANKHSTESHHPYVTAPGICLPIDKCIRFGKLSLSGVEEGGRDLVREEREAVPLRMASEVKQPVLAADEGPQAVDDSCALSQEISRSREWEGITKLVLGMQRK